MCQPPAVISVKGPLLVSVPKSRGMLTPLKLVLFHQQKMEPSSRKPQAWPAPAAMETNRSSMGGVARKSPQQCAVPSVRTPHVCVRLVVIDVYFSLQKPAALPTRSTTTPRTSSKSASAMRATPMRRTVSPVSRNSRSADRSGAPGGDTAIAKANPTAPRITPMKEYTTTPTHFEKMTSGGSGGVVIPNTTKAMGSRNAAIENAQQVRLTVRLTEAVSPAAQ